MPPLSKQLNICEQILTHKSNYLIDIKNKLSIKLAGELHPTSSASDINYYLGYGNRNAKDLWANDEWEQIEIMQALYESFPPEKKPEWLTPDDILGYGERMLTPLGEI